jgi:hypothetical protein
MSWTGNLPIFDIENRDFLGFLMIFNVWLNQIFSNVNTMLWTIKYRLSSITVYFTFTFHLNVKYTVIELSLYLMIHSIALTFENI